MKMSAKGVVHRVLFVASILAVTACSGETNPPHPTGSQISQPQGADSLSPEIASLEFSPQPAYANNALTIIVKSKNPGGPQRHYSYQWQKNGQIIEAATENILTSAEFKKGDNIAVTVTPEDGQKQETPVTSDPITIQNSDPMITSIAVAPNPLHKQGTVQAVVKGYDVDGDPVNYMYQWFKNGTEIQNQTGATLDSALIAKGDVVEVQVTPSDTETKGGSRKSIPVTVQNSPPRITSQPSTSVNEQDTYIYQVTAEDVDGDPATYSLTSAPPNMTIDPSNGMIRWDVTKKDVGIHPIEIVVTDADGAKTAQRYDLHIFDLSEKSVSPPP
ncbi:MAG: cadherin repeat domain-containing protein [Nitrospirae bacterium]|nr:cadherin repeat domain-containing protein [Nitrospirota bacterium]